MTGRLYEFAGLLLVLFGATVYLALHWPDDESDTTLRQEAAEVIGLIGALAGFALWALLTLPRLILAARREAIR